MIRDFQSPDVLVCRPLGLRQLHQERRPASSLLSSQSSREDLSKPDTSIFAVLLFSDLECFQRSRVRRKVSTTKPG